MAHVKGGVLGWALVLAGCPLQSQAGPVKLENSNWSNDIKIPRACSTPETSGFPFCNVSLPMDTRIKDLISRLTLEEKPPMLIARQSPKGDVPRLGIPEYNWGTNCIHGVQSRCGTHCPTSFPNPNALGASFNDSAWLEMGNFIGIELRALWLEGVGEHRQENLPHLGLDCWSPNVNINRDPRWGRANEVPSEDPYVNGMFGVAYTKGLQEGPDKRYLLAVSTVKHWDAYSLEGWPGTNLSRMSFNAIVSNYDYQDSYFPAFKMSVQQGNAKGIMCSYNAVNGVPACASNFLSRVLRDTWGFDGYVTSDSDAVESIWYQHHYVQSMEEAVKAALVDGGTDINSNLRHGNHETGGPYMDALIPAIGKGLLSEKDIDLALYRSLRMRFMLGLFDPVEDQPYWHITPDAVRTPRALDLSLQMSREGMVLLKNNANTLPLKKGQKIAVVGPHTNSRRAQISNYQGQPFDQSADPGPSRFDDYSCVVSPLEAITSLNVGGSTVGVEGCSIQGTDAGGIGAAVDAAKSADVVVVMLGTDLSVERESADRRAINLPGVQEQLFAQVLAAGKPTIVVLFNGGPVACASVKSGAHAIVEAFYPGVYGSQAVADVLFGHYNPGGKLPVTVYPEHYVDEMAMTEMSMTEGVGRSYKYYTGEPLWPFGYGLSYTSFQFEAQPAAKSLLTLDNTTPSNGVGVTIEVTNTGSVDGSETVLVFFSPPSPLSLPGPASKLKSQLVAFKRLDIKAGQSKSASFEIDVRTIQLVDEDGNLVSEPGDYSLVFTNGVDVTLQFTLRLSGTRTIIEPFPKF